MAERKARPTPDQILGPFYPVKKPADGGTDLTRLSSKSGPAQGEVIYVMGRVLNMNGDPVQGAQLEVWQANAGGRYVHSSDPNPAPLDPNFDGYANVVSDAEGRYRFKTSSRAPTRWAAAGCARRIFISTCADSSIDW